jgi:predicted kinase
MTTTPLVLHLNGAPAVGKSTLARLWADAHPGTLLLDIDELRTWVSGWRADFVAAGAAVRPVVVAMLAAYVAAGGCVVLPQLLADRDELDRFRRAAEDAGGCWVEVLIECDDPAARFESRVVDQPHLQAVHELVAAAGPEHLLRYAERLDALTAGMPELIRLPTTDGDVDAAYLRLVAAVAEAVGG